MPVVRATACPWTTGTFAVAPGNAEPTGAGPATLGARTAGRRRAGPMGLTPPLRLPVTGRRIGPRRADSAHVLKWRDLQFSAEVNISAKFVIERKRRAICRRSLHKLFQTAVY